MNSPKISIVTPTYNQGQYIEKTIQSVLDQQYPNLEYIIIDGGSTDGTVEVIKKYEKHLKYWICEPDNGQASAINKGLQHCTGEIFNWLNSDDYLAEGALENIATAFIDSDADAVAGQTVYFDEKGFKPPDQLAKLTPEGLLFWHPGVVFVQPGLWLKRECVYKCGGLDESYHYSFDTDMVVRYLSVFPKVTYIPEVLVFFRLHEESKTVSQADGFRSDRVSFVNKIANDPNFNSLHQLCNRWIEKDGWSKFLKSKINSNSSKGRDVISVFFGMIKKPAARVSRKSLGSIKAIITR